MKRKTTVELTSDRTAISITETDGEERSLISWNRGKDAHIHAFDSSYPEDGTIVITGVRDRQEFNLRLSEREAQELLDSLSVVFAEKEVAQ